MTALHPALISVAEALEKHRTGMVKLIDASIGGAPDESIPTAIYFDIDDICDPDSNLPHMIPTAEIFAEKVSALGISNDDHLVVFDNRGMAYAAARAWWLFRLFGHKQVSIMDGGMPRYLAENAEVSATTKATENTSFTARYDKNLVKKIAEIKANISSQDFQLVDARDQQRFTGTGRIPQSCNLFFMDLISQETGCLNPVSTLQDQISALKLDMNKPIAVTCGSGVTACILALAFYQIGYPDIAVYDGSWTEWSMAGAEVETA